MIGFQQTPEWFHVNECLSYPLSGSGEFIFVKIRKWGLSTAQVKQTISERTGVPRREIRHAGLKDAAATATQWLSWPEASQRAALIDTPNFQIVEETRHENTLAVGQVHHNDFQLFLEADEPITVEAFPRLRTLFPNFYGPQRFGGRPPDLATVKRFLSRGGKDKDMASVVQAWLFNQFLTERIARHGSAALDSDLWMREGSKRFFRADGDESLSNRYQSGEISPTGPIFGYKVMLTEEELRFLDELGLSPKDFRRLGKIALGSRRPLFVQATWAEQEPIATQNGKVILSFSLPSGSYATVFLSHVFRPELLAQPLDQWPNFTHPTNLSGVTPDAR